MSLGGGQVWEEEGGSEVGKRRRAAANEETMRPKRQAGRAGAGVSERASHSAVRENTPINLRSLQEPGLARERAFPQKPTQLHGCRWVRCWQGLSSVGKRLALAWYLRTGFPFSLFFSLHRNLTAKPGVPTSTETDGRIPRWVVFLLLTLSSHGHISSVLKY